MLAQLNLKGLNGQQLRALEKFLSGKDVEDKAFDQL